MVRVPVNLLDHKVSMEVAECSTDMHIFDIVLREVQCEREHDDKAGFIFASGMGLEVT